MIELWRDTKVLEANCIRPGELQGVEVNKHLDSSCHQDFNGRGSVVDVVYQTDLDVYHQLYVELDRFNIVKTDVS